MGWTSRLQTSATILGGALITAFAGVVYVPSALAFPHRAQIGDVSVYSVEPIPHEMATILAKADKLTAASPLSASLGVRAIYITDGGWRWTLLSQPMSSGAFALTRPLSRNIVVNHSSLTWDEVRNGPGRRRSLSGTIAHETTHLLITRHYGLIGALRLPSQNVEGYCDHVAQESSLSAQEVAQLRRSGQSPPALHYYQARLDVERKLAAGTDLDQVLRN